MRIESENGWVEILVGDDDEAFDLQCSVGDFSGRNPRVWIDVNDQRRFVGALRDLERDRRGEAHVAAMSPDEFELAIQVVDSVGHVSVEGMIGRLQYLAHGHDRLLVRFSFTLDPTSLPKLVRDVTDLMATA